MSKQIYNRTIDVNGIKIFYREAGKSTLPKLFLLHGFPSSSVMFKNLMTALSDKYHLIAPDYPGFGFSEFPDLGKFQYTFKKIAKLMDDFTDLLDFKNFNLYLHDYGCPIGLRICITSPHKIRSLIIQNGNAYSEGIGQEWQQTIDYWKNPTPEKKQKVSAFLSEEGTEMQYTAGLPKGMSDTLSPELWQLDWLLMQRNGNIEMQFDLNCDFEANMSMYPIFQNYFREHQPRTLIIWGKFDPFFNVNEAQCYKKDLKSVDVHILNGSHMLLETNFEQVLLLLENFLDVSSS